MERFKNNPAGFKELRKAILIKTLPLSIIVGVGSIAISNYSSHQEMDLINLLFVLPFMAAAITFGMYISLKKQKEIFESYVLTIDEMGITRTQANTATIRIPKTEIREIIKSSNGSFSIKADSRLNVIGVPAKIDNYERLEQALSEIKELSVKTSEPFLQKYQWLLGIIAIGLMAAVYISNNKLIVGISGITLLSLFGYSFFVVQKSKNVDNNSKKMVWILLFAVGSIITIMYYKLTL